MSDHEIPEEIARRLRPLGDAPAPDASPALAAFLADPVAPLTSDLSATAASNVNGPVAAAAAQAAGLPKRRRDMKQVLGEVLGAVARLGLVGKVALGAGAIALAGTGSAVAVNAVVDDEPAAPGVVQTVDGPDDEVTGEPVDDDADEPDDSDGDADDQGDDSDGDADGPDDRDDDSDSDGDADDQGDDSGDRDSDDQGDDSGDDSDDRDSDDRDDDSDSDDETDDDDDRDDDSDSDDEAEDD